MNNTLNVFQSSAVQRRLMTLQQSGQKGLGAVACFQMPGRMDIARLQSALKNTVMAHDIFHTEFCGHEYSDFVCQNIKEERHCDITVIDVCNEATEQVIAEQTALLKLLMNEAGATFSARMLVSNEQEINMLIAIPALMGDLATMKNVMHETLSRYANEGEQDDIVPFVQFSEWHNNMLAETDEEAALYWKEHYQPSAMDRKIPFQSKMINAPAATPAVISITTGSNLFEQLLQWCAEQNVNAEELLLSCWALLLNRHGGGTEIVTGKTEPCRSYDEFMPINGPLAQTIPVTINISGKENILDVIQQAGSRLQEIKQWQDNFIMDDAAELLQGRYKYCTNAFQYENTAEWNKAGCHVTGLYAYTDRSLLRLLAVQQENDLQLSAYYEEQNISSKAVTLLLGNMKEMLEQIVNNTIKDVAALQMLLPSEKELVLNEFSKGADDMTAGRSLPALFEENAQAFPAAIAVACGDEKLSYKELNEKANRLASCLLNVHHIQPGSRVAVQLPRSVNLVVAMLGIMKAGCSYIPLHTKTPAERLQFILADSNAQLLICEKEIRNGNTCPQLVLSLEHGQLNQQPAGNPKIDIQPASTCYTIYTSGSTGTPKGVDITHAGLANYLNWFTGTYHINTEDKTLILSSVAFDLTYTSLWSALYKGAALLLLPGEDWIDPVAMMQLLQTERITYLKLTPAHLQLIVNSIDFEAQAALLSLRLIVVGGEAVNAADIQKYIQAVPSCHFVNHYGPTETTIGTVVKNINADTIHSFGNQPVIGRPIANARAYILSNDLQPVPAGIAGELCIAGPGLAKGYVGNETLTQEKFIPNPFNAGEKIYRTGDLAKWLPGGDIEFIGRKDFQVKIRGYRVEPGEVEQAIKTISGVENVLVTTVEMQGSIQLVAYYSGKKFEEKYIGEQLEQKLPAYMIPSFILHIQQFPLTPNGKIDRKQLPHPETWADNNNTLLEPATPREKTFAKIWGEVLKYEPVSMLDNFFSKGGDSIKGILLVSKLGIEGYKVSVFDVFKYSNLQELAAKAAANTTAAQNKAQETTNRLSPVQSAFLHNYKGNVQHFNQSVMLKGVFDAATVQKALQQIVRHHDAFRLTFTKQNEQWLQQYASGETTITVEETDLRNETGASAVMMHHATALQSSFDLAVAPLFKAALYRLNDGDRLLLVAHHLIMDGVSWRILLEQLEMLLTQITSNETPILPPVSDSYLHWVYQLHQYTAGEKMAAEGEYWNEIKRSAAGAIAFEPVQETTGRQSLSFTLSAEATSQILSAAAVKYEASALELFLAALSQSCSKTGWKKAVVALEGHGREEIVPGLDISRTIGWFTSIYPVVLESSGEEQQLLKNIKQQLGSIPQKGIGYGLLKHINGEPLDMYMPICFNYLGSFDAAADSKVFEITGDDRGPENEPNANPYALVVNTAISNGSLYFEMDFDTACIVSETASALMQEYRTFLLQFIHEENKAASVNEATDNYTIKGLQQEELLQLYKKYDVEDICPLSPLQQGLFFHWRHVQQEEDPYFRQFTYRVKGNLDPVLVRKAFDRLMARYDILRAVFDDEICATPVQVIVKQRLVGFTYADLTTTADKEEAVTVLRQDDRRKGFRLNSDALMRVSVYKLEEQHYEINWSYHHIIMDGWSSAVLSGEFFELYAGLHLAQPGLLPPVSQYREYISWMQQQDAGEAIACWKNYLDGYDEVASLPVKKDKRSATYNPARVTLTLDAATTTCMTQLAATEHFTLNAFIQVIWGILLGRYTMRNDVVFGSVVSGRPAAIPGIEKMVGLFINTIPARIKMQATDTIPGLCRSMQLDNMRLQAYHHAQLADIQAAAGFEKELFDHFIGFENFPAEQSGSDEDELSIEQVANHEQTTFDLYITVVPGNELDIYFSYNRSVYEDRFIQDISNHFSNIINQCLENPAVTVSGIELLSQQEISALLFPSKKMLQPEQDMVQQLRKQAVAFPGRTALLFNGRPVSYGECNDLSDRLADYLIQNGAAAGATVAVWMRRSEWAVIALLGVLKSGAAFLPIDPSIPDQRARYMLEDAEVKTVLTDSVMLFRVMESFQGDIMALDIQLPEWEAAAMPVTHIADPSQAAYILFTSGSTGKPKGVVVSRANINYYLNWANRYYFNNESGYPFALFTSLSFDLTLTSIFTTLMRGDAIHIFDEDDVHLVLKNIFSAEGGIRAVKLTPSHISILPHLEIPGTAISHAIVGGEQLTPEQVAILHALNPSMRVFNEYGPTETTVGCSIAEIANGSSMVTIGKPITGAGMYIFNQYGKMQPAGVPGEIFIGGPGVAQGYLHQPELTAKSFVASTYTGKRLYRTGDKAKYLPGGNIEYMGRIDEQVKIRGYRIEPGEIAQVLASCSGVENCSVLVHKEGAQNTLVAFIVAKESDMENIRQQAAAQLPEYMVPVHFIPVHEIPLTANGKTDTRALLEQFSTAASGNNDVFVAPVTEVEKALAAIWQEVLDKEKIGIRDNFFRLGGHSLKIVMVISRVHRELGVKLDMRLFFDHPYIEEIAGIIDTKQNASGQLIPVLEPAADYEASPAQKRLWIINHLERDNTAYNITGPLIINGKINRPALAKAFKKIVERQESLRTTFIMNNDELRQVVHDAGAFAVPVIQTDISGHNNITEEAQRLVTGAMNTPFDLIKGPLFRVQLVRMQEEQHLLILSMHHIISDGWSVDVLMHELSALYNACANGMEDAMPVPGIQYKDYAAWQNSQLQGVSLEQHRRYWFTQLSGELPVLELPADFPLPQVQTFNGHTIHTSFSEEMVKQLKQVCENSQCSLYMLLLASVKTLLWRYTGQQDMIVGMPVSGRSEESLEQLIGFFVNTLPLRTSFDAKDTFAVVLEKIKTNVLDAMEHQVYPFDKLVEDLAVKRNPGRSPIFDVVVALQNTGLVSAERSMANGITLEAFEAPNTITKFHLLFNFSDNGNGLGLEIQYNTDLFTEARMKRMAVHLEMLMRTVCSNISVPVRTAAYMPPEEITQVKKIFSNAENITPVNTDIVTLFEETASRFPGEPALVCNETVFTYRELNESVNRLANYLSDKMNVRPGNKVALQLQRNEKMIIAIMAVLKAGAVYVPLDNDSPLQRQLFILEDTNAMLLIADRPVHETVKQQVSVLDAAAVPAESDSNNPQQKNTPDSLAYIMYTSGSTGQPKGVVVAHKAVIRLVTGDVVPPTGKGQRSLLISSYSFDGSVYSIYNTLLNGGALYVAGKEIILSVHSLSAYIRQNGITDMFVPTALFNLLAENEPLIGQYMQRIITGGEEASAVQITKCLAQATNEFVLYNAYGPTENTVYTTLWPAVPNATQIPIGKPISNTLVYILDAALQPVPVGIDGELYTGGNGLAEGYLNREEQTAEKFITLNGERLYKTGDMARWSETGDILFRGRIDHQAKINGYRIEPGEIESVLRVHPLVENAVVAVRGAATSKQLVAWLTLRQEESTAGIRAYLQEKIPSYMIPAHIMVVPEIPLNANGKTDFSCLPEPGAQEEVGCVLPQTEGEQKLAAIWNEVLLRKTTGIHDDFFDIGGHSLKATQIISRIARQMGVHMDLRTFFANPTIHTQARRIEESKEKQFYSDAGSDGEEVEEFIF